jgi:hypothetical protein
MRTAALKLTTSNGGVPVGRVPEKWDGKAAERIVEVLDPSRARSHVPILRGSDYVPARGIGL